MSDNTTIRRAKRDKEQPYFMMARATAQDHKITPEALGVLAELLSRPDDWCVRPSQLTTREGLGRDKVYRILNELITHGYVERKETRDAGGRLAGVEYVVYESPRPEKPDTVEPDTENPHTTYKRVLQSKEVTKNTVAPNGATDSAPAAPIDDAEYDAWKVGIETAPSGNVTRPKNVRPHPSNADVLLQGDTPQPTDFDLLVNAVTVTLKQYGGAAEVYAKMLSGMACKKGFNEYRMDEPVTATELQDWALWYERNNAGINKPTVPMKLVSSILEYRAAVQNRTAVHNSAVFSFDMSEG